MLSCVDMLGPEMSAGSESCEPCQPPLQAVHLTACKAPSLVPAGTFGEAFKAGGFVFKIVPMAGSILVNGEPQKRAEEILAEVSVTLTLSRLNGSAAAPGGRRLLGR